MRTCEQRANLVARTSVRILVLISILAIPVAFEANAEEPPRVAIVIGNNSYPDSPLSNPINDAQLIAETLRQLDFRVLEYLDVSQKEMKRAIRCYSDDDLDVFACNGGIPAMCLITAMQVHWALEVT